MDKYFEYYNPNPMDKEDACDCTIRALCAVSGLSWYEVYDKLCEIGRKHCVVFNSKGFMNERCAEFGLESRKVPAVKKGEKSLTVQKFCHQHPTGRYILQTAHHNIAVVNGKYYDLYVSDGEKVYKYWEKV